MARQIVKSGLTETQHDALDHTGLTGVGVEVFDETAHDVKDHIGLIGVPYAKNTLYVDTTIAASQNSVYKTLEEAIDYVTAQKALGDTSRYDILIMAGQSIALTSPIAIPDKTIISATKEAVIARKSLPANMTSSYATIFATFDTSSREEGDPIISMGVDSGFIGINISFGLSNPMVSATLTKSQTFIKFTSNNVNNKCYFENCSIRALTYANTNLNSKDFTLFHLESRLVLNNCSVHVNSYGTNPSGVARVFYVPSGYNTLVDAYDCQLECARSTGGSARLCDFNSATSYATIKDCNNVNEGGANFVSLYTGESSSGCKIKYKNTTVTSYSGPGSIIETPAFIAGEMLNETNHDLLDHTGLTGISVFDWDTDAATPHSLVDHTGLTGVGGGSEYFNDPVADYDNLPAVDNDDGDVRVALDSHKMYVWDAGAATPCWRESFTVVTTSNITVDPSSWRYFTVNLIDTAVADFKCLIAKIKITAIDGNATPDMNYGIDLFTDSGRSVYAYAASGITSVIYEDRVPFIWEGSNVLYGRMTNAKAAAITDCDVEITWVV